MSNKYWTRQLNVFQGCLPVSEGCDNCWAEIMAKRFELYWGTPQVNMDVAQRMFPKYRTPQTIFICNTSDLFHPDIDKDECIKSKVFKTVKANQQHTFLTLTKRTKQMRNFVSEKYQPIPNLWLGCTVENQQRADKCIPEMLECGEGWNYWLSIEPILGRIKLQPEWLKRIKSVVIGEENAGVKSRIVVNSKWFIEELKKQCGVYGVPYFVKQEWTNNERGEMILKKYEYQNNLFPY